MVYICTVGEGGVVDRAGTAGSIGSVGAGSGGVAWAEGSRASDGSEMESYVLLWF